MTILSDADIPHMRAWNLGLRFLLEITALVGLGVAGWHLDGPIGAVAAPLLAAVLWGVFNVPGDPSRSGKAPVAVPGPIRLLVELAVFTVGSVGWAIAGRPSLAAGLGSLTALHYIVAWRRNVWLLNR